MDLIIRIFVFSQIFFISGKTLPGQSFLRFENFSVEDGLPNNFISCIYQDNSGWIWVGTNHGLAKFDGYSFKTYFLVNQDTEGNSSDITCIYEDDEFRLWIGTEDAGLALYNRELDKFSYFNYNDTSTNCISSNFVSSIATDKSGILWVGTDSGINLFDPVAEKFQWSQHNELLPSSIAHNSVNKVFIDSKERIWIGTKEGLNSFNPESGQLTDYELKPGLKLQDDTSCDILEIAEDSEGNILIGTYNSGLFIIDNATNAITNRIPDPDYLRSFIVRALYEDEHGNIWIGTRGGIYIYSPVNDEIIDHYVNKEDDQNSLNHRSVHNIFEDKAGNIWISTRKGFSHVDKSKQAFRYFKSEINNNRCLNNSEIYAILESTEGEIWLGTESGGINIFNRETGRFRYLMHDENNRNSISSNCIKTIIQDRKGNFWIGSFLGGLDYYNVSQNRFVHFKSEPNNKNGLSDNKVWALCEDRHGNIWIGTDKGIDCYDPINNNFTHLDEIISGSPVYTIYEDRAGNMYFGTKNKGLFIRSDDLKMKNYDVSTRIIFEDSRGRIWIGSNDYKGLHRFDLTEGILYSHTTLDGLPSNRIYGILEDENSKLWISTELGLSMFDPDSMTFSNYELTGSKHGNHFNYGAYYKSNSGELLFGGQNGLCRFFPEHVTKNPNIPPVVITNLKIFNKEVPVGVDFMGKTILDKSISETEEIVLDYDHSVLTLDFVALNYINSSENQYAYFLEGFDKDWNYAEANRNATYTNLDPGKYTFRVKAANNDGIWNKTGAHLNIIVTPPIWKAMWFKLMIIVILCFIIFYINSLFVKRERLKDQLVLEKMKVNELNKIDMMKFQFFTNISHEIRTPVSLIVSPLTRIINSDQPVEQIKKDLEIVYRNATRLGKLIDQLLDFRKIEAGKLKLELCRGDIVSFLEKTLSLFRELAKDQQINLQFYSVIEQLQMYFDPDKVEKILFNLLSNAFKYTPEGGTVKVAVSLTYHMDQEYSEKDRVASGEYIQIVVKDSGIGIPESEIEKVFERFYQEKSNGNGKRAGSGIGLSLVRELVKIHKGLVSLKSREGEGTEVIILLPLVKNDPGKSKGEEPQKVIGISHNQIAAENLESMENQLIPGKPVLLILEDNEEFLDFIKSIFEKDYNVLTAQDGETGLKLANENIPDIIISDILMPGMDGKKFCQAIKHDFRTSHIPVLLLTALSSIHHEKEGLLVGADEYITKPFDSSLLKIKVDQLFANRKLIIEKVNREYLLQTDDKSIKSPDDTFLQKFMSIIEENISDPEFGTIRISREIGVSRTKLYRKMASLTGMTVKEFIRSVRLKRASKLIIQGNMNISEVCYEVGFQQVAHFRKCFKGMYGMTPSDYRSKNSGLIMHRDDK